ncbi:MAG: RDD family protein [Arenimonas sp.]
MSHVPSPAGFWKRYVAYFIDFMLVSTVLNIVSTPILMAVFASRQDDFVAFARTDAASLLTAQDAIGKLLPMLLWMSAASMVGYVVLAGAYFIGMEASSRQATLGKQLLGLKVTTLDGGRPGIGRVAGRFFAAALSWLTLNLGHALAAWTPSRRALHDLVAGTRVENVDPANAAMPTWGWVIVGLNVLVALVLILLPVMLVALLMTQLPY